MTILRPISISVVFCASLVACGGHTNNVTGSTGSGGGTGAGGMGGSGGTTTTTTTTTFTPAAMPTLPQVVNLGGHPLKSPKVQPIAYMSDPDVPDIEKFLKELTTTNFWAQTTSEYGVGPLTVLPTILITTAPPATITDNDFQTELAMNLMGATPAWGAADASTIYLFLIPTGMVISDMTGTSCKDYDGYHSEATITSSLSVPYAIGCSCPGFDGATVTNLAERTIALSHELDEAATDPFPFSNPAFGQADDPDTVWTILSGGEVADMCEFNDDSYLPNPGGTYWVQRSWSNKAAKALTNPCVPFTATGPYFNTMPVLPDKVAITGGGTSVTVPGVKIPVGGSKTIDLTLFSEAPTAGPWKVRALDGAYDFLGSPSANLTLTLDKTSGQNGDTLHLTIKVLHTDPMFGVEPFVILSTLGKAGDPDFQNNLWMGVVGQ
jgi:hypothetical protein